MTKHRVGIFPAAGGIGGATVKHILPRLPDDSLVFVARYPEKLALAPSSRVTVRRADYDDNDSLAHAFEGIDTLFIISYASVDYEHRADRHRAAIDAAVRSGVKYIFYGSLGYAGSSENKTTVAHVMRPHLDTERYLEGYAKEHPDFGYTVIREGLYSESYPMYTASFDPKHPAAEVLIPHDGSGPGIAWVKREELGEGTAELLARFVNEGSKFKYRNETVRFTGTDVLTLKETVGVLSKVAKAPVQIRQISEDEYAERASFTYRGINYSRQWVTSFEAFRQGEAACASPLLRELLGREPESFETTVSRGL